MSDELEPVLAEEPVAKDPPRDIAKELSELTTDQASMLERVKAQAPTAAVSAVISLVVALTASGVKESPEVPPLPELPTAPVVDLDKPVVQPRRGREGQQTRLVSCGADPRIAGDDTAGTIALGGGATSCTLLFAAPWSSLPTCVVNGGKVTTATSTDLVIAADGAAVSYRCGASR